MKKLKKLIEELNIDNENISETCKKIGLDKNDNWKNQAWWTMWSAICNKSATIRKIEEYEEEILPYIKKNISEKILKEHDIDLQELIDHFGYDEND